MRCASYIGCLFLLLPLCQLSAQEEYTWEMGAAAGGSFYMGDANYSRLFKDTGPAGGFIARYLLNPHAAIKSSLTVGRNDIFIVAFTCCRVGHFHRDFSYIFKECYVYGFIRNAVYTVHGIYSDRPRIKFYRLLNVYSYINFFLKKI